MKTFVKIESNNKGKVLVRVNDIVGIKELPLTTDKLYDEDGNLVKETPREKEYQVLVRNEHGSRLVLNISEEENTKLEKTLTEE